MLCRGVGVVCGGGRGHAWAEGPCLIPMILVWWGRPAPPQSVLALWDELDIHPKDRCTLSECSTTELPYSPTLCNPPPPPPPGSSQCWSRQTPAWTRSVHLDAPGQRATAPSPGWPTPGSFKQEKSSGGSVDTTKTRSGPQRVRMSSGERPIGAAKGTQLDTEALCQHRKHEAPKTIFLWVTLELGLGGGAA